MFKWSLSRMQGWFNIWKSSNEKKKKKKENQAM